MNAQDDQPHEGAELQAVLRRLGSMPLSQLDAEPGLERVHQVASQMDLLPQYQARPVPTLIVAGTNGKGSTCAVAEALLMAQGVRVGCTMSPHIHRYNERIRIDGVPASDTAVIEALTAVDEGRGDTPLSYFEMATLAALWAFRAAGCEAIVLEVGLGGRLDAANVCDADVAVVTSIGLDHAEWLGTSLDGIGLEKAAVRRPGKPLVLGSAEMPSSLTLLARLHDGPVLWRGRDFEVTFDAKKTPCPVVELAGGETFQISETATLAADNIATALVAVSQLRGLPTAEQWNQAQSRLKLPGRLQTLVYQGCSVIVDVAHNPAGARFLGEQLERIVGVSGGVLHIVFGCYRDKDAAGILAELYAEQPATTLSLVGTHGPRSRTAAELEATVANLASMDEASVIQAELFDELDAALDATTARADAEDIICVFGSFELVGSALKLMSARDESANTELNAF